MPPTETETSFGKVLSLTRSLTYKELIDLYQSVELTIREALAFAAAIVSMSKGNRADSNLRLIADELRGSD